MTGLLARRPATPFPPPAPRLVFDVVCRINDRAGEKPTGWHMMTCWATLDRAAQDLLDRRLNLIKGGVRDLEYDIRERAL